LRNETLLRYLNLLSPSVWSLYFHRHSKLLVQI